MIILTIRTDKPEAEIGLYDGQKRLEYTIWQAHRELAETIHKKMNEILNKSSITMQGVQGIVCYRGPGSFTGLRIGLSVGNALSYGLSIPIVSRHGSDWLKTGIKDIKTGKNDKIALPEYDAPALTTKPRK